MPTVSFSYSDLAVYGITAFVIGAVAFVGSQHLGEHAADTNASGRSCASSSKKKKKKKGGQGGKGGKGGATLTTSVEAAEKLASSPAHAPDLTLSVSSLADVSTAPPPMSTTSDSSVPTQKSKKGERGDGESLQPSLEPTVLDQDQFPALGKEKFKVSAAATPPRPLAERMQKKTPKTKVDDMLDVEKPASMARVMRITEEPAASPPMTESEAEDGWEKVPNSKKHRTGASTPSATTLSSSTSLSRHIVPGDSPSEPTKKQRQNHKRREAAKATKAAEESGRLSRLVAHRRQAEAARRAMGESDRGGVAPPRGSEGEWETVKGGKKGKVGQSAKEIGGGMKAAVGEDGRLIWE